jgi:uncharacterized MAPEG superfamily protein
MPIELKLLIWTIVLGFVQLFIVAGAFTAKNGIIYGASPRDTPPKPLDGVGGRFKRAFDNLLETFPLFAAAVLAGVASQRLNGTTAWGAHLYFWSRVAYVPLYAAGIPFARSAVWLLSVLGIFLVLFGIA